MRRSICMAATVVLGIASQSYAEFSYQHDDGFGEGGIGQINGNGFLAISQYTVTGGQTTIESVSASWFFLSSNTTTATAAVWSDPDQDGNPADAELIGFSDTLFTQAGWQEFQRFDLMSDIVVGPDGTSFFVGMYWDVVGSQAVRFDSDYNGPIVSWTKPFIGEPADPEDLSGLTSFDSALMIRANAIPSPGTIGFLSIGGMYVVIRRRR